MTDAQIAAIQGGTEMWFLLYKNGASFVVPDDAQIELGSTATNYVEHEEQDYTISLGTTELCKIGDYQDKIYKNNGKWYLHKETKKIVLDGTQSSSSVNTSSTNTTRVQYNHYADGGAGYSGYSNLLTFQRNWSADIEGFCFDTSNGGFWIRINKATIGTTASQVNTYLSNNNLICYIPLATPTETEITDTTLLSQLEALEGATTYLGETNINTSGSDLSPLLDVTTYSVDNPSFTITNSGNIYSKPIITIYGLGTVGLYLNGIQVLSLDMGSTTSQITIDVAKLEAYNQETGALMNRNVTGDYNNLVLNVGENTITESGTLQGLEVENYSRWL